MRWAMTCRRCWSPLCAPAPTPGCKAAPSTASCSRSDHPPAGGTPMNANLPTGFDDFRQNYEQGHGRLLWLRGVADLETPVAAFLKLAHGKPFSFPLESGEGGAAR